MILIARTMFVHIAILLATLALNVGVLAADNRPPLAVGFLSFPPFMQIGHDGSRTGYMIDLANEIAADIGVSVEFHDHDNIQGFFQSQIRGDTHLMAGVAALENLKKSNSFSQPIATARVRIAVAAERAKELEQRPLEDLRVGFVPPTAGASEQAFLSNNVAVEFGSTEAATIALLTGAVDALLIAEVAVYSTAKRGRLEHRIAFIGDPVREFERVVALHDSRVALRDEVSAAIASMEADGRLLALRQKYFLELPLPPPATLRVGVRHAPPRQIVRDDGEFTGFSVEVLRDLANRAGIALAFEEIKPAAQKQGPHISDFDLLPEAEITDVLLNQMDFALPLDEVPHSIFVRTGNTDGIAGLADLAGLRVGIETIRGAQQHVGPESGIEFTLEGSSDTLFAALMDDRLDAVVAPSGSLAGIAENGGFVGEIEPVGPPVFVILRAPALRFGLGEIRERLNAVIPTYLISDDFRALRAGWFGKQVFWTERRVRLAAVAVVVGVALLIGGFVGHAAWRRRQAINEHRRFAAELIDQIPLGMVLVSKSGQIEFANAALRARNGDDDGRWAEGNSYRSAIEPLVQGGLFELGDHSHDAMVRKLSEDAMTGGFSDEFRMTDGSVFVYSAKGLSGGSTLITQQDMTEERRRLREIGDLNDRLEHQVKLANLANEELRTFAYATSHDLKAPTNTLTLLTDALTESLEGRLSDDETMLFEKVRSTNQLMARLIEDILDYTNAVGADKTRQCVALDDVLDQVLEALHAEIVQSGATIRREPLAVISVHPSQTRQLMQNLISNAIKFHAPGRAPLIDVTPIGAPEGSIGFRVSDNGIGIPADRKKTIFKLFTRLHTEDEYSGTGVGLALCQKIARNHGGRIDVTSEVGNGSRFDVTLKKESDDLELDADRRQRR